MDYDSLTPYYIATGLCSIAFTVALASLYCKSARYRVDPSSHMLLLITCCDLGYTLKFTIGALLWQFGETDLRKSFHVLDDHCVTALFMEQFFSLASQSWNACWVVSFMFMLYNPLANRSKHLRFYHAFCWTMSSLGAVAITIVESLTPDPDVDGSSCWMNSPSLSSWLIIYIPLSIYMILALTSLVYAAYRLYSGMQFTYSLRRGIFARYAVYVVAFVVLWMWPIFRAITSSAGGATVDLISAVAVTGQATVFAIVRMCEPGPRRLILDICCRRRRLKNSTKLKKTTSNTLRTPLLLYGPVLPTAALDPPSERQLSARLVRPRIDALAMSHSGPDSQAPISSGTSADSGGPLNTRSISASNQDLFDVGSDLRQEYCLYLLSALVEVLNTPKQFADAVTSVAPTPANGSPETEPDATHVPMLPDMSLHVSQVPAAGRFARSVSVLTGDVPHVVYHVPPRRIWEEVQKDMSTNITRRTVRVALQESKEPEMHTQSSILEMSDYDLTIYHPKAFATLRQAAGLDAQYLSEALSPVAFCESRLQGAFSEGASSSFFCRSSDKRYILKTVTAAEVDTLMQLLPSYMAHLGTHPQSLLCRFYGCWSLSVHRAARVYFVLMNNVMPLSGEPMTEVYDLKFSSVGRETDIPKTTSTGAPVLKDSNFRKTYPSGIRVAADRYTQILNQLNKDTQLLADNDIMDYSLLLGIKRVKTTREADELIQRAVAVSGIAAMQQRAAAGDGDCTDSPSASEAGPRDPTPTNTFAPISSPPATYPPRLARAWTVDSTVTDAETTVEVNQLARYSPLAAAPLLHDSDRGSVSGRSDRASDDEEDENGVVGLIQVGIIDVLQQYDLQKKLERGIKTLRHANPHVDISAVDPATYAARFRERVATIFRP